MAESFIYNTDSLVTKDYLDAKLEKFVTKDYLDARFNDLEARMDARFARFESRFTVLYWMMGLGFSVLIIPQLQAWFS